MSLSNGSCFFAVEGISTGWPALGPEVHPKIGRPYWSFPMVPIFPLVSTLLRDLISFISHSIALCLFARATRKEGSVTDPITREIFL